MDSATLKHACKPGFSRNAKRQQCRRVAVKNTYQPVPDKCFILTCVFLFVVNRPCFYQAGMAAFALPRSRAYTADVCRCFNFRAVVPDPILSQLDILTSDSPLPIGDGRRRRGTNSQRDPATACPLPACFTLTCRHATH